MVVLFPKMGKMGGMKQVWGGMCGRVGKLFYFRCDKPK